MQVVFEARWHTTTFSAYLTAPACSRGMSPPPPRPLTFRMYHTEYVFCSGQRRKEHNGYRDQLGA